ncbi:antitoxin [Spirochaetia bacterium]|nr:antitoxin [Spirochaetia bacterium]
MPSIPHIRPVSELRNKFSEISRQVHETNEPVYLTKNGRGDMVVMSMEAYEQDRANQRFVNQGLDEWEVYLKLKEAEIEAESTTKRYSHEEVMASMEKIIAEAENRQKKSKKKI